MQYFAVEKEHGNLIGLFSHLDFETIEEINIAVYEVIESSLLIEESFTTFLVSKSNFVKLDLGSLTSQETDFYKYIIQIYYKDGTVSTMETIR